MARWVLQPDIAMATSERDQCHELASCTPISSGAMYLNNIYNEMFEIATNLAFM
jgi:hypothetical protein